MTIIDDIIKREGELAEVPADHGGVTKFGITKGTLSWYRGKSCTDNDIRALTVDEAKSIYQKRYISGPGFDNLSEGVLKSNMIDFGVLSGPQLAITHLQQVLNVVNDGVLGPKTLLALSNANPTAVNIAIAKRRVAMCGRICVKDPTQLAFLNGWLSRLLSFL